MENNKYIQRCLSTSDFNDLRAVSRLINNNVYLWYDKELGTLYFDDEDESTILDAKQKITCSRYLYIISILAMMRNLASDNDYNNIQQVFDQQSNEVDSNVLAINIMKQYSSESNVSKLYKSINNSGFVLRRICTDIDDVITTLNNNNHFFKDYIFNKLFCMLRRKLFIKFYQN